MISTHYEKLAPGFAQITKLKILLKNATLQRSHQMNIGFDCKLSRFSDEVFRMDEIGIFIAIVLRLHHLIAPNSAPPKFWSKLCDNAYTSIHHLKVSQMQSQSERHCHMVIILFLKSTSSPGFQILW